MTKNILEVKKLKKYYGDIRGVESVSLYLKEGEAYGFIGPNGAGKSTTIKTIMNLINKTSGSITINGKENDKNNLELKRIIGYLPSEINLYSDLTVREMLDFHESFYDKCLTKRRNELVNLFKLDETKRIEDLSFGNLKKLGIILALIHEPKILILDEPTSGLDPIMQKEFYNILLEEKKKGTTILYSTHVLSEVSKICDRVGIIKDGHLLKVETIKELKNKNLNNVTILSKDVDKISKDLKNIDFVINNNKLEFKNTMDSNKLIKLLSKYDIEDLLIEEATLEEMFLHYYN